MASTQILIHITIMKGFVLFAGSVGKKGRRLIRTGAHDGLGQVDVVFPVSVASLFIIHLFHRHLRLLLQTKTTHTDINENCVEVRIA
ncbi:hypothetical protein F5146DRAFT_1075778 [Armillaria mellea]|nr:hypothetical protein F5146DRAFT_1075778 [Armillaria mellea]